MGIAGDRILAIVPAFNEEESLASVLAELRAIPTVDIVVVNDGSHDTTSGVAHRSGVTVIDLPVNAGMFCAVQAGFRYAYRNRYKAVVQVDADGQHDPRGITALVKPLVEQRVDLVIGSRFLGKIEYKMPWQRRIGTKSFACLTSALIGQKITDTTCGFRAYGPAVIKVFATENSFEFRDAIGLVMLHRGGFSMIEVPAVVRQRSHGTSSINALRTLIYPFHYLLALLVVMLREPIRKDEIDAICD